MKRSNFFVYLALGPSPNGLSKRNFLGEWGKRGKRQQCSVMDGPAIIYMDDGSAVQTTSLIVSPAKGKHLDMCFEKVQRRS